MHLNTGAWPDESNAVRLKVFPHLCHVFNHVSRNRKKTPKIPIYFGPSKLLLTCNMEVTISNVSWPFGHNIFPASLNNIRQTIFCFLKISIFPFHKLHENFQITYDQEWTLGVISHKAPWCHVILFFLNLCLFLSKYRN